MLYNIQTSLMKKFKLNFVPNDFERQKFYSQLSHQTDQDASLIQHTPQPIQQHQHRTLNKQQLDQLLKRLSLDNKQTFVKEQIARIQLKNKQWIQQKNSEKRNKNDHHVEERLIQKGKIKQQKIQNLRKIKIQHQKNQLRDKPIITDRYLYNYKPLKDRVPQILQTHKQNLKIIEKQYQPNFIPNIDRYSAFIGQIKNQNTDFANRLHNNDKVQEKKSQIKAQLEQKMKKDLTFQPKINPKSRKLSQNFQSENRFKKSQILNQQQKQLFKPKICKKSIQIIEGSNNPCFMSRLDNDYQKRKAKEALLNGMRKSECSFQPKINPNSRRLASSRKTVQYNILDCASEASINSQNNSNKKQAKPPTLNKQFGSCNDIVRDKNISKLLELFGSQYNTRTA